MDISWPTCSTSKLHPDPSVLITPVQLAAGSYWIYGRRILHVKSIWMSAIVPRR